MIDIEWITQAFDTLEAIPISLGFEIVRRVDALGVFPEMGVSMSAHYQTAFNYRQLIIKGNYRVLYRYDADRSVIFVAAIQHCRQQLPSYSDLQRAIKKSQSE
jgi:plasmid stabilization system protein ParE